MEDTMCRNISNYKFKIIRIYIKQEYCSDKNSNFQVRFPDGSMEITFPDGSIKKIRTDGSEDIWFPGNYTFLLPYIIKKIMVYYYISVTYIYDTK